MKLSDEVVSGEQHDVLVVGGHNPWRADPELIGQRALQLRAVTGRQQQLVVDADQLVQQCRSEASELRWRASVSPESYPSYGRQFAAPPAELTPAMVALAQARRDHARALEVLAATTEDFQWQAAALLQQVEDLTDRLLQISSVFDGAELRARGLGEVQWLEQIPSAAWYFMPSARRQWMSGLFIGKSVATVLEGFQTGRPEEVSKGTDDLAGFLLNHSLIGVAALGIGLVNDAGETLGWQLGRTSARKLISQQAPSIFGGEAAQSNTQTFAVLLSDLRGMLPLLLPPLGEVAVTEGRFRGSNGQRVKTDYQLSQLITRLDDLPRPVGVDAYTEGRIHIVKHEGAQGNSWTVIVQGTQNWSPVSLSPQGFDSDLESVAGEATTHTAAVLSAMNQAGISPDDPVELVGHSLGGATVQLLAADSTVQERFNIGVVTTLGAPALSAPLPGRIKALSLRHSTDPVTALGTKHLAPSESHAVVVKGRDSRLTATQSHAAKEYAKTMREVEATGYPVVEEFADYRKDFLGLGDEGVAGTRSRLFSYEATRDLGIRQRELPPQVQKYAPLEATKD
ncbi:hypothetical protein [Boudabousia marimammalium]|uniref:Fungal lipase-like domain-containing protein n=1 Tax=Boudabousia marimammalium TaxID=156892 RepID=A0A1Q5PSV6_9ACTO|nr:hypothetical protein [Boudabousia marimammalium]OKL50628.1 hypothetical protein BM477_01360 [Boudabousia marimammalium]